MSERASLPDSPARQAPISAPSPPSPLADLLRRYRAAAGRNPATTDAAEIARALARHEALHARRDAAADRAEAARVAREQAWHVGVARGTHCILRCEQCHAERIVPMSTRRRLLRLAQEGRRPRFDCADCRDRHARRAGERAALAKTVAEIARKGTRG